MAGRTNCYNVHMLYVVHVHYGKEPHQTCTSLKQSTLGQNRMDTLSKMQRVLDVDIVTIGNDIMLETIKSRRFKYITKARIGSWRERPITHCNETSSNQKP